MHATLPALYRSPTLQGQDLAGFHGGPMAGCLCSKAMLDTVIGNAESNSLAKAAGITRSKILDL